MTIKPAVRFGDEAEEIKNSTKDYEKVFIKYEGFNIYPISQRSTLSRFGFDEVSKFNINGYWAYNEEIRVFVRACSIKVLTNWIDHVVANPEMYGI